MDDDSSRGVGYVNFILFVHLEISELGEYSFQGVHIVFSHLVFLWVGLLHLNHISGHRIAFGLETSGTFKLVLALY